MNMPLTRDFKETIRARVKRDPGFRKALLREGIENFLSGDVETGKIILRDFINATIGFTKLSDATHRSAKSLMRMLGPAATLKLAICLRSLPICSTPKAYVSRSAPRAPSHTESTRHLPRQEDGQLSRATEYFTRLRGRHPAY
jgi:hypothetical protein